MMGEPMPNAPAELRSFTVTIGADVRAYANCHFDAVSKEDAIAQAKAWVDAPRSHQDFEPEEVSGEITMRVQDDADDSSDAEFENVECGLGPDYSELLSFVEQMARLTTPEDEFEALKGEDGIASDDGVTYDDVGEYIADLSDDRLMEEYAAFATMIREARKLMGSAA